MSEEMGSNNEENNLIALTTNIVSAYVSNNTIRSSELQLLISEVYGALQTASNKSQTGVEVEKAKPAVNPKRSVHNDYIICLEDGKKFKSLKRHLKTHYNLTPEQYREKWGLDADYPMVAPAYAEERSKLAKQMGLGRKSKK